MNTGSRDEQIMLANIDRIAKALENIETSLGEICNYQRRRAQAEEHAVFGVTSEGVARTSAQLIEDLKRERVDTTAYKGEESE